jgi:hypothetical protein
MNVIEESCPRTARPFIMNFLRLWIGCTVATTLLFVPSAIRESNWDLPFSALVMFGLIFGW